MIVAAQTRKGSVVETMTNTVVGFVLNQIAQVVLFPVVGIHVSFTTNLALGLMFTGISIARGYALRRFFQWRQHKALTGVSA